MKLKREKIIKYENNFRSAVPGDCVSSSAIVEVSAPRSGLVRELELSSSNGIAIVEISAIIEISVMWSGLVW